MDNKSVLLPCLAAALAVIAIAAALPGDAHAQQEVPADWAYVPDGLGPGDTFRLMFASTGYHQTRSDSSDDYHSIIKGRAASSGLAAYSDSFNALVNTDSHNANIVGVPGPDLIEYRISDTRIANNVIDPGPAIPIYWVNGARVADSGAQLIYGSWQTGIGDVRTEHGRLLAPEASYRQGPHNYDNFWFATGMYERDAITGGGYYALGDSYVGCTYYSGGYGGPGLGDRVCSEHVRVGLFGLSDVFQVRPDGPTTTPSGGDTLVSATAFSQVSDRGGDRAREGDTIRITIDFIPPPTSTLALNITLSHTGNTLDDRVAGTRILAIPAGTSQLELRVPTIDDRVSEALTANTVTITLNRGDYNLSPRPWQNSATASLRDTNNLSQYSPPPPTAVSIGLAGGGSEGDPVSFGIGASPAPLQPLPVNVTLSGTGGVLNASDAGWRIIVIPPIGSYTLEVPTINDNVIDDNTVTLTINPGDYELGQFHTWTVDVQDAGTSQELMQPPVYDKLIQAQNLTAVEIDPALVANVTTMASQVQHGDAHVERWNRVLAAFGEIDHSNPMTAAEAQTNAEKYSSPLWPLIVDVLTLLEAAAEQDDPQTPPDTPPDTPPTIDQALINSVRELAAQTHHGDAHVDRWNRVLAAFGEIDHSNPMTAAEAQTNAEKYSSPLWPQIAEVLAQLESR